MGTTAATQFCAHRNDLQIQHKKLLEKITDQSVGSQIPQDTIERFESAAMLEHCGAQAKEAEKASRMEATHKQAAELASDTSRMLRALALEAEAAMAGDHASKERVAKKAAVVKEAASQLLEGAVTARGTPILDAVRNGSVDVCGIDVPLGIDLDHRSAKPAKAAAGAAAPANEIDYIIANGIGIIDAAAKQPDANFASVLKAAQDLFMTEPNDDLRAALQALIGDDILGAVNQLENGKLEAAWGTGSVTCLAEFLFSIIEMVGFLRTCMARKLATQQELKTHLESWLLTSAAPNGFGAEQAKLEMNIASRQGAPVPVLPADAYAPANWQAAEPTLDVSVGGIFDAFVDQVFSFYTARDEASAVPPGSCVGLGRAASVRLSSPERKGVRPAIAGIDALIIAVRQLTEAFPEENWRGLAAAPSTQTRPKMETAASRWQWFLANATDNWTDTCRLPGGGGGLPDWATPAQTSCNLVNLLSSCLTGKFGENVLRMANADDGALVGFCGRTDPDPAAITLHFWADDKFFAWVRYGYALIDFVKAICGAAMAGVTKEECHTNFATWFYKSEFGGRTALDSLYAASCAGKSTSEQRYDGVYFYAVESLAAAGNAHDAAFFRLCLALDTLLAVYSNRVLNIDSNGSAANAARQGFGLETANPEWPVLCIQPRWIGFESFSLFVRRVIDAAPFDEWRLPPGEEWVAQELPTGTQSLSELAAVGATASTTEPFSPRSLPAFVVAADGTINAAEWQDAIAEWRDAVDFYRTKAQQCGTNAAFASSVFSLAHTNAVITSEAYRHRFTLDPLQIVALIANVEQELQRNDGAFIQRLADTKRQQEAVEQTRQVLYPAEK
ncbi:MAG: hypothetical protein LBJ38_03555 [Oscillospiraceae bacterium]|jgi:hypothetical protein|nr:hypothetical protein [Oscillospiraceae bacterium]